jgi:hypothetical protein
MRKSKGHVDGYDEAVLPDEEDDFEPSKAAAEAQSAASRYKARGHNPTRQLLEMRDEEQRLRKQLSDWDEDFDIPGGRLGVDRTDEK